MLKKIIYRLQIIKKIFPFTSGARISFFFIFLMSILSMLIDILIPQVYKIFIDDVVLGRHFRLFGLVIAGYLAFFLLETIAAYIKNHSTNKLVNSTLFRVRNRILYGYLNMDFSVFEKQSTGDLKMKIDDDTNQIREFASTQTIDYFISYITILISTFLLFSIEWRLALFSIVAAPVTFFIDHKLSKKEKELFNDIRENDQETYNWLYNSIQGWKEIKALNLQNHEKRIFVRYLHKFANYLGSWFSYWVTRVFIMPKIKDEFLFRFCLYFFGGLLIMKDRITIGALLVFIQYFGLLSKSINNVSTTDAELQRCQPFYNRVLKELERNAPDKKIKVLPEHPNEEIVFENVGFSYHGAEKEILKSFNLRISKGDRIAITGKSGAGKTTMLKLLTGILRPTSGRVTYCNHNISDFDSDIFFRKIGFVMQENILFNMSIKENLLFGKTDATEGELDEACKKASIYDFIQSLPKKYETVIGERGIKLSGGQRQRLVLAKFFLHNADILILDEATSAIDQYSENIIHKAINSLSKHKTIIVVAHRPSSISFCDRIISLDSAHS